MINNTVSLNSVSINDTVITTKNSSDPVSKVAVKTLIKESQPCSTKILNGIIIVIKILIAPITILAYLIFKSISQFTSKKGLGTDVEATHVDEGKREQLLNLGGQEISFGFKDEPVLEGMFFETSANAKTILLCTGSHFSYEKYAVPMIEAFKSMGCNVMLFNYEGFGNSKGERTEEGVYRSVEAAYQYLKQEKKLKDENIVAWGYSLGSGAVSELASKHKIDIAIDRGFSSMSEVAYQIVPNGQKTIARILFIIGTHFDNLSKLKKAKGNILIAQGINDNVMKEEFHGRYLKEAISNNPKATYAEVDTGHHHKDQVWFGAEKGKAIVQQFLS